MSLWSLYKGISPKVRIYLGLGLMVNAGLALQFSDQIEQALGVKPTKQEEEQLARDLPSVSMVERTPK